MRQRFLSAALFSLLAAGAAFACADGDDADDKPKNTGGAGGGGGSGGGVGGFGGVGGSSGGSGGSGGATGGTGGATGGSGGQSGSGGSGGTGGADASLDAPSDVSLDSPAEAEAGLDAGNCVPAADAGPAPDAGCAAGQYYNPCKQSCVPCSDLSWLDFHDPVGKVAGLSGGKDALFPRVTTLTSTDRVVLRQTASNELDLYTATAQGAGWTALTNNLGNLVNYPNAEDSGPLIIPTGAKDPSNGTVTTEPFILFDSKRDSGKHQIYLSTLFKSSLSPTPLASLNQGTSGKHDYNPAYAYLGSSPRLYWSSDRDNKPGLYTRAISGGAVSQVALTLEGGCAVTAEDVEPWVTPDGTVLFFSSPRHEQPNCALAIDGGNRALFYSYMDPATGTQIGTAKEIKSVRTSLATTYSKTSFALRTPSLGPSSCTLYFSSNADATADYDVFSAPR
ncbi:MAG: hypothetical protein IT375_18090 [Polyangiaceae bacterium]|nr:hypothetical protein [Polyangiaceae bacterium]